jgi:hypothetical protein
MIGLVIFDMFNFRDLYRRQYAAVEKEREIMRNVPGWQPGQTVYNGSRYVTLGCD